VQARCTLVGMTRRTPVGMIEAQQATISSIESTLRLQNRCFLRTHENVEDIEKNNKELEKRVSALEPPELKK
jgi:hypothetical protein